MTEVLADTYVVLNLEKPALSAKDLNSFSVLSLPPGLYANIIMSTWKAHRAVASGIAGTMQSNIITFPFSGRAL